MMPWPLLTIISWQFWYDHPFSPSAPTSVVPCLNSRLERESWVSTDRISTGFVTQVLVSDSSSRDRKPYYIFPMLISLSFFQTQNFSKTNTINICKSYHWKHPNSFRSILPQQSHSSDRSIYFWFSIVSFSKLFFLSQVPLPCPSTTSLVNIYKMSMLP